MKCVCNYIIPEKTWKHTRELNNNSQYKNCERNKKSFFLFIYCLISVLKEEKMKLNSTKLSIYLAQKQYRNHLKKMRKKEKKNNDS